MNKELLQLIEEIWNENSTLRLMQLIGNCFEHGDLYYVEDDVLFERLRKVYLKGE